MISRALLATAALVAVTVPAALAAGQPDTYVVNFRNDDAAESARLDASLRAALMSVDANVEEVVIDTSTAAKWEKGAHEAFDRDIVPIFNKWVGLPGFAAIVDARTKQVVSCVNSLHSSEEIAREIRKRSQMAAGRAVKIDASVLTKTTQCPPAHNSGH